MAEPIDWTFGGSWPFQPRFHHTEDGLLHYVDEGPRDGPAVVLLHGNPTWGYVYRHAIPALLDAGCRTVVPDLLGYGRSDKPDDLRVYAVDQHRARLAALLDSLDLRRATVVVHDWGGPIGLPWAVQNPDRVAGLFLLNTFAPRLPGPMGSGASVRLTATRGIGSYLVRRRDVATEGFLFRAGVARRERLTDTVKAAYRAPHRDPASRAAMVAFPRQIPRRPDHPVAELTARTEKMLREHWRERPATICWGAKDVLFGTNVLDRWRQTLPGAQVTTIEHAGHFLQEDAHEEIVPLLRHVVRTL